jgi:RNA polymerase sigma factor (sigma-70 family)
MDQTDALTDSELLVAARCDAAAFAVFYGRHERRVLAYLVRRVGSAEVAADVCAEVFATVLAQCRSAAVVAEVPVAWLFGIANHKLADGMRQRQVEDRARVRLQMRALELTRGQVADIETLAAEDQARSLLDGLSAEQRTAVLAHVIDERTYSEIASQLRCSEAVVRKRVSSGLAALRANWDEGR